MTHASNCIRSEGDWICSGDCTVDRQEREEERVRSARIAGYVEGLEQAVKVALCISSSDPVVQQIVEDLRMLIMSLKGGA